MKKNNRRYFNKTIAASVFANLISSKTALSKEKSLIKRTIPSSGETIPVIGLGTSSSFQSMDLSQKIINNRKKIVLALLDGGGKLIDTAPSYKKSESIIGEIFKKINVDSTFFIATKVRKEKYMEGIKELNNSFIKLDKKIIDLIQIHNLVDTENKLSILREWKNNGRYKYIGVTHWLPKIQEDLLPVMRKENLDFVQFQYNIEEREAEKRILPLAEEKGISTIINVPFGRGKLFTLTKNKTLPDWAKEFCSSWAQFYLKYIISHPAVTCVIPGTSKVDNMKDNIMGGKGRLPDKKEKLKMIRFMQEV